MKFKVGQLVAIKNGEEWEIATIADIRQFTITIADENYPHATYSVWELEELQASSHGILAYLMNLEERLETLETMAKQIDVLYRHFIREDW